MNEIEMLLASMDEAFDKRSWHGTNLRGSLRRSRRRARAGGFLARV